MASSSNMVHGISLKVGAAVSNVIGILVQKSRVEGRIPLVVVRAAVDHCRM